MSQYKLSSIKIKWPAYVAAMLLLPALLLAGVASAERIGVGISTGKIELNKNLKPGITYELPKVAVFNNGSNTTDYEMSVQFNEKQSQLKPAAKWVSFSPQNFTIKPGKARQITIKLRPSSSAHPGTYFAYLEARPLKKDKSGKTAINIAAATKLTFKVAPANIFQKLYYFLVDIWNRFKHVIIPIFVLIAIAVAITFGRRNLSIEVNTKKKKAVKSESTDKK